jgi:hypothetical protein
MGELLTVKFRQPSHEFTFSVGMWSCYSPFFGFRSLVDVSFYLFLFFLFFLMLLHVCVVNALIKGEIEDHVWFEDRWMVASLCDE